MLKIDTEKIWKLLKKDKKIQKKLQKYTEEECQMLQEATSIYQKEASFLDSLKNNYEQLSQKEDQLNQNIIHKNGDISILEIKKLFSQSRLKKLYRIYHSLPESTKKQKYRNKILKEEAYCNKIQQKQEDIKEEITGVQSNLRELQMEQKEIKKDISRAYDKLAEYEKNMFYWQEQKEKKEHRFYQASFEEVSENFKPCQDLIVPDLEDNKKMTRQEAKKKANPILIDEEYILSDPTQLHVRKLTKDEKEEYRKSA